MVTPISASELKECAFFKGIDWDDAADRKVCSYTYACTLEYDLLLLQLNPPLIPSRTQVNINNPSKLNAFNDDDIKDIKVCTCVFASR